MPTINQTSRNKRHKKLKKTKVPGLQKNPFKKGICRRILIVSPKKPNRADRKIAKVWLNNNRIITAAIPGEGGHSLQQHSIVLVRGARVKDLPGVSYKLVRGVYDLLPVEKRKQARSKYGTRKGKK